MAKDKSGSAFPWVEHNDDGTMYGHHMGLTKREYFAGKALQAELSNPSEGSWSSADADKCAERCIKFADALIKELNQ